nr:MAG TPA: hypothetical protein [Caudoviricetes sp.]
MKEVPFCIIIFTEGNFSVEVLGCLGRIASTSYFFSSSSIFSLSHSDFVFPCSDIFFSNLNIFSLSTATLNVFCFSRLAFM